MLTTINLPTGTERIYLRDVPGLIADALYPEVPEDTPRVLRHLKKKATNRELAWQWCGLNNNFAVSITEQDLRELNEGVWRHLSPLELLPDTCESPRRVATPLPEPEWEKYADALAASPPEGWRLIPEWHNKAAEQQWMSHKARKDWKRLLEQQAATGHLKPRAEVSGIPMSHMAGHQLMAAFLTVTEFAQFASQFDVEVRVGSGFPAQLPELNPSAVETPMSRVAMTQPAVLSGIEPSNPTHEPAADRGRYLKRSALISNNLRRWPTIERDLKDAAGNGLSAAARDKTSVGWWWEGSALDWARARRKVDEPSRDVALWTSTFHRING